MVVAVALLACPGAGLGNGLLVNGSFETATATTGWTAPALPTGPGYWLGDSSAIVDAQSGITPLDGSHMLQFRFGGIDGPSVLSGCEVYQVVDLSSYAPLISTGNAVAKVRAYHNRVPGDAETDTAMYLRLSGYAGEPGTFPAQHSISELVSETEGISTDADPGTWEPAALEVALPVNTGFVAVVLVAAENVYNDTSGIEFDGHYADAVSLVVVPEPVTLGLMGLGGAALLRRRRR